jgi:hypothetical protein
MTTSSAQKLDDLSPHQLIDEVKQITEQYSREVNTARRTWPRSVKDRVLALSRLGVPGSRIAVECGIPSATVFSWCGSKKGKPKAGAVGPAQPQPPAKISGVTFAKRARFLALKKSDTAVSIPTVGMELGIEIPPGTIPVSLGFQILLPGGVEVRGLTSVDQVLALYRGYRA